MERLGLVWPSWAPLTHAFLSAPLFYQHPTPSVRFYGPLFYASPVCKLTTVDALFVVFGLKEELEVCQSILSCPSPLRRWNTMKMFDNSISSSRIIVRCCYWDAPEVVGMCFLITDLHPFCFRPFALGLCLVCPWSLWILSYGNTCTDERERSGCHRHYGTKMRKQQKMHPGWWASQTNLALTCSSVIRAPWNGSKRMTTRPSLRAPTWRMTFCPSIPSGSLGSLRAEKTRHYRPHISFPENLVIF